MPELLLELLCEEIPARMQARAADDLRRLVTEGLVEAGLTYEGAKAFATPRRLALTVQGLTARSADIREERKGPRVGAPPQALEGFLRAAGLASIDAAQVQSDPKKGDFYVAVVSRPGRAAETVIADLIPQVVRSFPWPKSMRWGARSAPVSSPYATGGEGGAALRWVRPLRSILCTFGPETEEPVVVPVEIGGIIAGDVTLGHRFMAGARPIRVRRFDDYVPALERAKVVLDGARRRAIIETEAKNLAFAQGLELVDDPGLLDEVAGLVEWPVVLMGAFDPAFLAIPDEVIRLTIRANQKCFVLLDPASGRLADRFILTANIEASDGGAAIVAGNERVIAARLADARFFWEQDLAVPLADWGRKLESVTFHEKLGTQAERVERVARLAREIAPLVGAEPEDAELAARLAKADLTTGMVGEFPELQGVMGRYYFLEQQGLPNLPLEGRSSDAEGGGRVGGEHVSASAAGASGDAAPPHSVRPDGRLDLPLQGGDTPVSEPRLRAIADAIRDHYRPQGPGDAAPSEPVAIAVALADKLDTLVGFWAIDEKPTGSKDPYALRRAALGVVRTLLERGFRVSLARPIRRAAILVASGEAGVSGPGVDAIEESLLAFFAERLKTHLRETGSRHDLIDAVFALPGQDDLLMIVRRVEALGGFLDTDDGANLLTGYRRAANILRAEEKKDGEGAFGDALDPSLIAERGEAEERGLFEAMRDAEAEARAAVEREDFTAAMSALAGLRPAVDAFFERVTVNAAEPEVRKNRLRLLSMFRRATLTVADFSRIGG